MDQLLTHLEEKLGIKIVFAAVTGSRLYNMHSEDSDYDLKVVYVQKPWCRKLAIGQDDEKGVPDSTFTYNARTMYEGRVVEVEVFGTEILRFFNRLTGSGIQEYEAVYSPFVARNPGFGLQLKRVGSYVHNKNALCQALMSMAFGYLASKARNRDSLKNAKLSLRSYATAQAVYENGFNDGTFARVQDVLADLPVYVGMGTAQVDPERTQVICDFLRRSPILEIPTTVVSKEAIDFANALLSKTVFEALRQ